MEATAFSPAHITGLLEICDLDTDPLKRGSKGAGFSLQQGVTTYVQIRPSDKNIYNISINRVPTDSAFVSEYVLKTFLPRTDHKYFVGIQHQVDVPIGSGFGSSGAAALSLALALNKALELGLSKVKAAQIAHVAEVECKTGLGTVASENVGGFEIRLKPGAPGIGKVEKIGMPSDIVAVMMHFCGIPTYEALTRQQLRSKINDVGSLVFNDLLKNKSFDNFISLSRRFAESLGLISDRMKHVMDDLDRSGYASSMAMFGETIFSLVNIIDVTKVINILSKHALSEHDIMVSGIDVRGARLV